MNSQAVSNILSISAHETGNFTSDIFIENNNMFGMKQAKVRDNTATGTKRGHAVYCCYQDSVIDFLLWWQMHNINVEMLNHMSLSDMVKFMADKGYFEAPMFHYLARSEYWRSKLFDNYSL